MSAKVIAVLDALDRDAVIDAVGRAEPEVVVHELTALGGFTDFRKFEEGFAVTDRLRTEGTDHLLEAPRRPAASRRGRAVPGTSRPGDRGRQGDRASLRQLLRPRNLAGGWRRLPPGRPAPPVPHRWGRHGRVVVPPHRRCGHGHPGGHRAGPHRGVQRRRRRPGAGRRMAALPGHPGGAGNAKARQELGWRPAYASWRTGFRVGLGGAEAARAA